MKKQFSLVFAVLLASIFVFESSDVISQPPPKMPQKVSYSQSLYSALEYRCIGPSRGGRATAVAGIPTQPSTFYFGATGGGVWKTTDYGQNWRNVSDGFFATGSIGAIRVSLSNPDVVYVGTGSDGIRSNVITGKGVYKSSNGGKTWTHIGLKDVGQIGAVEIHPDNHDIVYVAAIGQAFAPNPERGVYRTKDGGSTWELVLFISEETGAVDLELAPDDPNTIYAGVWHGRRQPWTIISGNMEGGLYKSTDAGDNWKKLTEGLPKGVFGKSDFAVSAADPARVYALIEANPPEGGLYRSDDRGETWSMVTDYYPLLDRPFYYLNIDVDPSDADVLYANSTGYFRSTDAGKRWNRLSTPHGDNHDIWINPNDPDLFVQCNDGGANVTRDGGRTWSSINNQLTAELYQVAVDDQFPYWVYAGQQDNSTIMVPSLPPYSPAIGPKGFWQAIGGCETGPAVPKPGNHNIVYANCKGRFGRYNKETGQEKQYYVGASNMYGHNPKDLKFRFQRVSPIHISPHDPNIVYHASQYLHKTTDEGVTWETISPDLTAFEPDKQVISGSPITRDITGEEFYSTIYAVQESPLEKGLIWVGANDGPVHVTRDGGDSWTNVTPQSLPPGGRVQTIEPSPHRPGKAFFATYRYLMGDWKPYIYKTKDYGKTWSLLTNGENGIPADFPTRVIREDPDREGLLYAGTEFGMFISFDEGFSWQPFQLNLPVTPITDIKVYRKDLVLSTMGRSFWILDDITPLHQLSDEVASAGYHLYSPRKAYRMRYRGTRGGSADPEYIRPGVIIDYYLSEEPAELRLEILDAYGNLVRTFSTIPSTESSGNIETMNINMEALKSAGTSRLNKKAGMHRFIWDMSHAGAWSANSRMAGRRGPTAVPGIYQVRLSAGDWSSTEKFELLADPRIVKDGVTQNDMLAQLNISFKVRDLISRTNMTIEKIKMMKESASNRDAEKLDGLYNRLVTAGGRYPQPMISAQISYLYSMLNRADQKPGKDAYIRYDELKTQVEDIIAELNQINN